MLKGNLRACFLALSFSRARKCGMESRVRTLVLVLVALVLFHSSKSALAQARQPRDQGIIEESWTPQQGAPDGITSLAQTADGFLWIGASTGLYRFDGIRFQQFHATVGDQLMSGNIFRIFAPPSGGLWVGYTFGGFSFVNNGRVRNYRGELAVSTGTVRDFAQDGDGVVWAGSSTGVWRFSGSSWQRLGPKWNGPSRGIARLGFDQYGVLWALEERRATGANNSTLLCLRPGTRHFQIIDDHLSFGFTFDADGEVVTVKAGRRLGNSSNSLQPQPSELPVLKKGHYQFVDRSNGLWIIPESSDQPLVRATAPAEFQRVRMEDTHPEAGNVYAAGWTPLVDREENVWFSSPTGIRRFFYTPLIEQKSRSTGLFVMDADDHGAVWIGPWTAGSRLCRIKDGAVDTCLPSPAVGAWSVAYRAMNNTFWFGGRSGLWHYLNGKLLRIALPPEMAAYSDYIQAIAEDRGGGLWISFGRHGLYRYIEGTWTPYGGRQDLPKTGVVTEFSDSLDRVWFGYTNNRLAVLDGNRVETFGPADGVRVGNITAIKDDGSGMIWIGGENGLQYFANRHFHDITAINGKWMLGISGIVETANGDLWLNGENGIFHIGRQEIAKVLTTPDYQVGGQHFGDREGAPGSAAQIRPLPTAIEGSDGRLWFAGSHGVVWLDPATSSHTIPPPPVVITSVSTNKRSYDPASALLFPAHTPEVRISFAAISLSDPEAIRFRYRLRETDTVWRESDRATPVTYQNLAPGSYHFSVNASDTNGMWSNNIATADFTLLPAWYQTVWFHAAIALIAILALWLIYRVRLWQVSSAISARADERLAERTRMARELHDTFIQTIQGSKMVVDDALENSIDAARMHRALTKLAAWLERAIHESRAALNSLRESTSTRNDLREAFERVAEATWIPNSMSVNLSVIGDAREMHPIIRDEIYHIGFEAIRNAAQHSRASRLDIELRYAHDLVLQISDNGIGVDPTTQDLRKEGHYGLQGMRERAGRIGGKLTMLSTVKSGTIITLAVPAELVYRTERRSWLRRKIDDIGD